MRPQLYNALNALGIHCTDRRGGDKDLLPWAVKWRSISLLSKQQFTLSNFKQADLSFPLSSVSSGLPGWADQRPPTLLPDLPNKTACIAWPSDATEPGQTRNTVISLKSVLLPEDGTGAGIDGCSESHFGSNTPIKLRVPGKLDMWRGFYSYSF